MLGEWLHGGEGVPRLRCNLSSRFVARVRHGVWSAILGCLDWAWLRDDLLMDGIAHSGFMGSVVAETADARWSGLMIKHPGVGGRYGEDHEGEPGEERSQLGCYGSSARGTSLELMTKRASKPSTRTIHRPALIQSTFLQPPVLFSGFWR